MAQDKYLTLQTTPAGMNMIIRTLYGGSITFTKMVVGNGRPQDLDNVTALENPLLEVALTDMTDHDDYLVLTGYVTSSSIASSFYGNELGVYALDENDDEYLYAYRYSETDVDFFPSASSGRTLELTLSVVVQLGNAENVTAILIEGDTYALKSDFDAHTAAENNPHSVTKTQVGLENVPNVSTNDQTPTYTMASTRANLTSGEKLSVAFGKIAKAIKDLITHLTDTNNPHQVSISQVGGAAANHTHNTSDINGGTLSELRGGTGASKFTDSDLAKVRTATLTTAGWSANAPYTQAVNVTGITSAMAPVISHGVPATVNAVNYKALVKAFGFIDRAVTGDGKITFYCYNNKPTVAIPVLIKGV